MGSGTNEKASAWGWIYDKVLAGVEDPQWFPRVSVGAIGIICVQLFREIGDCRLPLNVGTTVAAQLFEMQNIATDRRIDTIRRTMESQSSERREFRKAVLRNVSRARVRLGLKKLEPVLGRLKMSGIRTGILFTTRRMTN